MTHLFMCLKIYECMCVHVHTHTTFFKWRSYHFYPNKHSKIFHTRYEKSGWSLLPKIFKLEVEDAPLWRKVKSLCPLSGCRNSLLVIWWVPFKFLFCTHDFFFFNFPRFRAQRPVWYPPAAYSFWVCEMWPVQIEMCC